MFGFRLDAVFFCIECARPGVAAVVVVFLFEACFSIEWVGAVRIGSVA